MKQLYKKFIDMLAALSMYVGMSIILILCSAPLGIALAPLIYEIAIGGFFSK